MLEERMQWRGKYCGVNNKAAKEAKKRGEKMRFKGRKGKGEGR